MQSFSRSRLWLFASIMLICNAGAFAQEATPDTNATTDRRRRGHDCAQPCSTCCTGVPICRQRQGSCAQVNASSIDQNIELMIRVVQGKPGTVSLGLKGAAEVLSVTGELIESWSVRSKGEEKFIDLQLKPAAEPPGVKT